MPNPTFRARASVARPHVQTSVPTQARNRESPPTTNAGFEGAKRNHKRLSPTFRTQASAATRIGFSACARQCSKSASRTWGFSSELVPSTSRRRNMIRLSSSAAMTSSILMVMTRYQGMQARRHSSPPQKALLVARRGGFFQRDPGCFDLLESHSRPTVRYTGRRCDAAPLSCLFAPARLPDMSLRLEVGVVLAGFELLTRIGQGGMASVWVARGQLKGDPNKRVVAVKAMLPELAQEEKFRRMFLEEGRLIQSIHHEHVVDVLEVGEDKGILYMAMEWVEGDSLHALIAEANKRRPIPAEIAIRLIADTAGGLHAAHEVRDEAGELKNIVHCDVSPHNILVGVDGAVKLVDFGVASAMHQLSEESTALRGKFAYMSPEQTRAAPLDRRSDIFSLGIVLFELTTGYRLFRGETPQDTVNLVRSGPIPHPSQLREDYPKELERITLQALNRDPEQRFQTAEDLRQVLEQYLIDERILVPSAGIGGLLKRVLGEKLNDRRHTIRAAILALDDGQETAFMPDADELRVADEQGQSPSGADAASGYELGVGSIASRPSRRTPLVVLALGALAVAGALLGRKLLAPAANDNADPARVDATGGVPPRRTLTTGTQQAQLSVPDQAVARPSTKVQGGEAADPQGSVPALDMSALPKVNLDELELEAEETSEEPEPAPRHRLTGEAAVLAGAARSAARCAQHGGPTGAGRARLSVTKSGRVVGVSVSAPFAKTKVGHCIASKFKAIRLDRGKPRSVTRTFRIR
jgi:serine/threonine protein kinase